jgi:hypothetical protein
MFRWFEKSVTDMCGDASSDDVSASIAQLTGLDVLSVSVPSFSIEFRFVVATKSREMGRSGRVAPTGAAGHGIGAKCHVRRVKDGIRRGLSDMGRSREREY